MKKLLPACLGLVACAALLNACSDNKKQTESQSPQGVTADSVKAQHVKVAYAAYSDSLTTATALQSAVDALLASPTEANLAAAKTAYKAARAPYQQSEIMRWDTDITLLSNTGDDGIASVDEWEGQVNAWPLDESLIDYVSDGQGGVKAGFIIAGDQAITAELLTSTNGAQVNGLTGDAAEANVATGVHAIEFLLWGQDLNGTAAGAGNRPATDYSIENCTGGNCERRRQYLKVVTDLLVSDLTAMVAEWSPTAAQTSGTLAYNFLQSPLAIDAMLLSIRTMATDELASARMGSGLTLFDTEEEHDCFSDLSHVAIYHNLQGVLNAVYGRYHSPVDGREISGPSFADLIEQQHPQTFTALDSALTAIESNMHQLLELGERSENPIRFDQIIGQGQTTPPGEAYTLANQTSLMLTELDSTFEEIRTLLALANLSAGDGDGD